MIIKKIMLYKLNIQPTNDILYTFDYIDVFEIDNIMKEKGYSRKKYISPSEMIKRRMKGNYDIYNHNRYYYNIEYKKIYYLIERFEYTRFNNIYLLIDTNLKNILIIKEYTDIKIDIDINNINKIQKIMLKTFEKIINNKKIEIIKEKINKLKKKVS